MAKAHQLQAEIEDLRRALAAKESELSAIESTEVNTVI